MDVASPLRRLCRFWKPLLSGGYSTDGTCPTRPVATASDACPIVHSCGTDSHGCLVHRYENSCGAATDGCRTCPGTAFCDGNAIAVASGRAPCKPGATAVTCRAAAYRQTCANGCRGTIVDARYPGGDLIAFAAETFIGDQAQLGCNELPRDGSICNGPRECHPAAEGVQNLFCDQADRTIPGHCRPANRPSGRPAFYCDRVSSDCISVCGVLIRPPSCVYDEACSSTENCLHPFGSAIGFCLPRRLGRDLNALACP
jgi:hypothetical protein